MPGHSFCTSKVYHAKTKNIPFLTGFIGNEAEHQVYGRPVGVAFTQNGTLLVADDASNTIWQISPTK